MDEMRSWGGGGTAGGVPSLAPDRVNALLTAMKGRRMAVVGDMMLDHFIWGRVRRISPEAPVPVVEFQREAFMPGGAANVARNLTALGMDVVAGSIIGRDDSGGRLAALLEEERVNRVGLLGSRTRPTATKTRIVAGQQQVTRLDRETIGPLAPGDHARLLKWLERVVPRCDAVLVADYGKGVVSTPMLEALRTWCRPRGIWISADPKPGNGLDLGGMSLLTPNRKELFDLTGLPDDRCPPDPLRDEVLAEAVRRLMARWAPGLLLVTLGEAGMLLCRRHGPVLHIPTTAREVYDVSGAGDTVIAVFTAAVVAGASPVEAAVLSNHAAGVVVAKFGTATVHPDELRAESSRGRDTGLRGIREADFGLGGGR